MDFQNKEKGQGFRGEGSAIPRQLSPTWEQKGGISQPCWHSLAQGRQSLPGGGEHNHWGAECHCQSNVEWGDPRVISLRAPGAAHTQLRTTLRSPPHQGAPGLRSHCREEKKGPTELPWACAVLLLGCSLELQFLHKLLAPPEIQPISY